jgi:hypothetical protein
MLLDNASPQDIKALSLAQTKDDIRHALAQVAWNFYRREAERSLVTVHKWKIGFSLKVRHLRPAFVALFGDEVF